MASRKASPTEETVIKLWSEILGIDVGSAKDDFFDLGGNSLDLINFLQRIWDLYQLELSTPDLLERGFTVAQTARAIDQARSTSSTRS